MAPLLLRNLFGHGRRSCISSLLLHHLNSSFSSVNPSNSCRLFCISADKIVDNPRASYTYIVLSGRNIPPESRRGGKDTGISQTIKNPSSSKHILDRANFAISRYNELNNTNLELGRVVKATTFAAFGLVYILTIEVKNKSDGGASEIYEAVVQDKRDGSLYFASMLHKV